MVKDIGRSGIAVGLSSGDGAASVSALRDSIPNAILVAAIVASSLRAIAANQEKDVG